MPIPLSVEVIVIVPCLLCRGCVCWREELCAPNCIYPNPQWRFPVWEVLCGRYSENPSVWRRGHRAVARISKHILLFAIDPLSQLSLSFISCIVSYSYHIYAWYCLCASLVLN